MVESLGLESNSDEAFSASSSEEMLPLVYEELRQLAASKLVREKPGHTLQATALVHEAWLRLQHSSGGEWSHRGHFFAAAAEAMRRILIDSNRRKSAERNGGALRRVSIDEIDIMDNRDETLLMRINECVEELENEDPILAQSVKLRFFVGMTIEETALAMEVSDRTIRRYWRFARIWLYDRLNREVESPSS